MTYEPISTWAECDYLISVPDGAQGYVVTVEQLLRTQGGRDAFFRKVSRSGKIQRAVYQGLQYDRSMRAYYAPNWDDISKDSGPLRKSDRVFVGFTY